MQKIKNLMKKNKNFKDNIKYTIQQDNYVYYKTIIIGIVVFFFK